MCRCDPQFPFDKKEKEAKRKKMLLLQNTTLKTENLVLTTGSTSGTSSTASS